MTKPQQKHAACALLIASIALFTGCATYAPQQQRIPAEVQTDRPTEGRPTLGLPVFLPQSETSVVPFTIDRPKRWLEDSDRFEAEALTKTRSTSSGQYRAYDARGDVGLTQSVRWHNAVIQTKDGPGQLVLDAKGFITQFDVVGQWVEEQRENPDDEITYRFDPKAVLFLATLQDTDDDKLLTSSDANVLFAADKDGGRLHKITPAGKQVQTMRYHPEQDLIVIMVTTDTDGDGLFTEADSAAPYVYQPGSPGPAKPLVDPKQAIQAEQLLQ